MNRRFSNDEVEFILMLKTKLNNTYNDIIDSILNKMYHINDKIDKNAEATRKRVALKRKENKHYGR